MVSSAIYRYFASRDDLLTALIIDAYDALGEAAEAAEAAVDRSDLPGRFARSATPYATGPWRHPHEYALTYGSPVPGYAAPQDTLGPASRVSAGPAADPASTGSAPASSAPQPGDWLAPPVSADMAAHRRARRRRHAARDHGPRHDRLDRAVRGGQLRGVRPAQQRDRPLRWFDTSARVARLSARPGVRLEIIGLRPGRAGPVGSAVRSVLRRPALARGG